MSSRKQNSGGTIYFMRRADGVGPIKIGCTKQPLARLNQVQEWSPEPLTIIASASGKFKTEARLHRQFDAFRLHGEWFEAAHPVLAMVAKVHSTGVIPPAPKDDKWQQIASLYREGQTLQSIGDKFGITRERVRQILRKAGVPTEGYRAQHKRTSIAAQQEATIRQMHSKGATVPEMAEAVGDCQMNVRSVLRRAGLKANRAFRKPAKGTVEKAKLIAADYAAGMKTAEIARRHDTHQPSVYRYLRIAGIEPGRRAA